MTGGKLRLPPQVILVSRRVARSAYRLLAQSEQVSLALHLLDCSEDEIILARSKGAQLLNFAIVTYGCDDGVILIEWVAASRHVRFVVEEPITNSSVAFLKKIPAEQNMVEVGSYPLNDENALEMAHTAVDFMRG